VRGGRLSHRAVPDLSAAIPSGLLATHALLAWPELFNAIIAVSPTLDWDDDLMLKREEILRRTLGPQARSS
jgi:predicted alpha/beta superfamily hydrolase